MKYETFTVDSIAANIIADYYKNPPKAYMRSFGCQQNVNDGERIRGVLASIGYDNINTPENADLIIFNTCAVREHAEKKVFGNIGELKHLKQKNNNLVIAVCGCMVQQQQMVDKIKTSYPFVDLVFGPNGIDTLPSLLAKRITSKKRILENPVERMDIIENIPVKRDTQFKAWVPIMYGCDNFCSYCIVPYVRGRERSRKCADIFEEVKNLVQNGYKEITLLGQNVNSYGKGLSEEIDFSDLLKKLCQIDGEYILRFMTSHPKDASKKLIDTIAENSHIAKNIHLPVQSGSDSILQAMNRKYTVEDYLKLISYAKEKIENVTFSSDIIVGFPGETEKDFQETLQLIEKVGYTQLFTFIYSKRTGTKAATMPDATPAKVKSERIGQIKILQEKSAKMQVEKLIGTTQRILVEGKGKLEGVSYGHMVNNCIVEFADPNSTVKQGDFTNVKIVKIRNSSLVGELI